MDITKHQECSSVNGESVGNFYWFFLKLFCVFYNDLFFFNQNNHMYVNFYTQTYVPKA